MAEHALKAVIEAADRAIGAEDFDAVMAFYADDAVLIVRPGLEARGLAQIRTAHERIAAHFGHRLTVRQGRMTVLEAGNTALVLMESLIDSVAAGGAPQTETRRATYVFRRSADGRWLCIIDNSYGTDLIEVA
ncbi:YybH family protein [Marinibaculum pumilum]|uniref:YybH family protein n=1 Tax=Marinibaculum pumilum TaxID=1766165 RepID=A0ABV7KW79_9PROT